MGSDASFLQLQSAAAAQGIDLAAFRPEFLARRLKRSAILAGELFVDREIARLVENRDALAQFLDQLSISVSAFYRDRLPWALLEERVLPRLRRSFSASAINAWSAACAEGHEPWSLAILLAEQRISCQLWASDLNAASVQKAERGVFAEPDLQQLTRQRYARFFQPQGEGRAQVSDALRKDLRFLTHDLSRGLLPALTDRPLHLVLCRNVLIYLSQEARSRLCQQIARQLAPGGYLLLGTAEHLPEDVPLIPVDLEARLFRRDET